MQFKNQWLQIISEFVPQGYQHSPNSFMNYIKSLPETRQNIRLYSIAICGKRIQVLNYLCGKTDVETFGFNELENMVTKEYRGEFTRSEQMQMHFDNQLKNAF